MKNIWIVIIVLGVLFGGVGGYIVIKNIRENIRIENIKKGWYIEITHDEDITIRSKPSTKGKELGKAKKGEVYKVIDINLESSIYYWYKIEFKDEEGWIASGRKIKWVDDVNNPTDIATPEIRYFDDVYEVSTIDDINYKHLEVIEDTDKYTITHIVYHEVVPEENKDQYWILYTVTDDVGKSSSKLQKIVFDVRPDEARVTSFKEFKRPLT